MLGDCLERMKEIPDGSVDAIICDPPYGTTDCKWDSVIPFEPMWEQLKRVIKPKGAIVLFGSQPFTSALIMSNPKMFKYEWIWKKNRGSGHLNAKKMPMKYHENILVFSKGSPVYYPIRQEYSQTSKDRYSEGEIWKPKKKFSDDNNVYGKFKRENRVFINPNGKSPESVQEFKTVAIQNGDRVHPTQKPVALMEYLIKTYTNEGETVLDFTMGSGSTGVACVNTGRNFIGIELDQGYFDIAKQRIKGLTNEL